MIESNDTNIKVYDIEQANTSFGAELDTNDELFDVELMETDELFDVELMESDELFDAAFDEDEQTMEVEFEEVPTQTPSGPVGTTDHSELINRDKPKQHPIKAIDGLEEALADKQPKGNYLTKVPEGYVKSEELKEYAKSEELKDYAKSEELEEYAKSEELEEYAKSEDVPVVPEWAMQPAKPNYTVDEVGADPSGSSAKALEEAKTHTATVVNAALETSNAFTEQRTAEHNTDTDAHNDLRLFLKELNDKVNHFLDIDDTTKDQASEIVKLIEDNRGVIEQITTDKINFTDIVDNLFTNVSNKPLSAAQGVMLKALIDKIIIPTTLSAFTNDVGYLTEHQSLEDYAKKSELPTVPTNVSAFTNDSGYLTKGALLDVVYPVGSIYMSVNNVSPKTFLGGTWEVIKDRFLLSAGGTYSAGSTGGEETHTLTIEEMPSHNHGAKGWAAVVDGSGKYITLGGNGSSNAYYTRDTGGGQPHNNMPPYLAVYMWKRTA